MLSSSRAQALSPCSMTWPIAQPYPTRMASSVRNRPQAGAIASRQAAKPEQVQAAATEHASAAAVSLTALAEAARTHPLGSSHLEAFLATLGVQVTFVRDDDRHINDPGAVKSLVFVAEGEPLLVVMLGADKVDMRKLAQVLGVQRSKIRLATAAEARQATGFKIGTIPPLGHVQKLRTLLDLGVTEHAVVCGGGGAPNVHTLLSVPDLLHFAQAQVADLSLRSSASPSDAESGGSETGLPQQLPLPWAPGSKSVQLIALIVKKHRISKRLLFASVVPVTMPELPARTQASHLRRVWQSPCNPQGQPVEVQLILGKTLERTLGQQTCDQLLGSIRIGSVVCISGVMQEHPPPRSALPSSDSPSEPSRESLKPARPVQVIDVVCHRVSAVYPDRKALQQAEEAGATPEFVQELLRWQQQQQQLASEQPQQPERQVDASSWHVTDSLSASVPSSLLGPRSGAVGAGAARSGGTWQLPLPASAITVVDTLEQLRSARQHIMGNAGQRSGGAGVSGRHSVQVVGIDCEWAPQGRGKQKHPVAVMQVATADAVYLLDLLALCNRGSTALVESPSPAASAGAASRARGVQTDCAAGDWAESLTDLQIEAGLFIRDMLEADHVLKLGFSLASDLDRLEESYPWILDLQGGDAHQPAPTSTGSGLGPLTQPHPDADWQQYRQQCVCRIAAAGKVVRSARTCLDLAVVAQAASGVRSRQAAYLKSAASSRGGGSPAPWLEPAAAASLSKLAEAVLGLPLDKGQQRSEWAVRPLSPEQVEYAAADAHVLISILDHTLACGLQDNTGVRPAALAMYHAVSKQLDGYAL